MKKDVFKKSLGLFGVAAGVLGLALTAIPQNATAQMKDFGGIELTIATFPSTWEIRFREEVGPAMEKMNVKLKFIGGRSDEFLAKMIAAKGSPTFDIVEITDHVFPEVMAGGFVDKLNFNNIPNVQFLNSAMYDDYKVGYWQTQAAILYNYEAFKKLGLPAPTQPEDLLHPKLKGKVTFPTLTSYGAIAPIIAIAKKHGGDEKNIDPALPVLRKFAAHVHSFTDFTPFSQAMKNGDIYAGFASGGSARRLRDAGVPMAINHLEIDGHKGVPSFGYLGVVKGSKHKAAAEAFINEAIGKEMQEGIFINNGTIPTNGNAQKMFAGETGQEEDPFGTLYRLLAPETIKNMYYLKFEHIDRRVWGKKLLRVQAGK